MRSWVGRLLASVVASMASAAAMRAQVVRGEVREIATRAPVIGAAVFVQDTARRVIGFARTDERGRFTLRIPVAGFAVRVARVGFAPESVSTAGLDAPDTTNVLIDMRTLAVRLTPVVIEAEKRGIREQRVMGLNLKTLSTYIITPSEIEVASRGARNYLDAIRVALPAGVTVWEERKCLTMPRAAGFRGRSCAMVIVDGVPLQDPAGALDMVQPQWLDHAIFLRATDAGMRFGTGSEGGVLLLFTKFGGYALDRP